MFSRRIFITLCLIVSVAVGCQQKRNKKQSLRTGRGGRGMVTNPTLTNATTNSQCGSYYVAGKQWGEVTGMQGDQAFWQEVYNLTAPVLSGLPADDQLGYVSAASGQPTGVRFWGHAQTAYGNGQGPIDMNTAEIRIEIFDDRACQPKGDGSMRPMIPVHIGRSQPDFVRAEGNVNGGQVNLLFEDKYGMITLQGQIMNGYFSGDMSYSTAQTGGQLRLLGRFTVPTCGFFICN